MPYQPDLALIPGASSNKKYKLDNLSIRPLEELLQILPASVKREGRTVGFGLHRNRENEYQCYAFDIHSSDLIYLEDGAILEYATADPKISVCMMIGHLQSENLISITKP